MFKESGTYNLRIQLRIKLYKTIDGRGRDIRITGMGVLAHNGKLLAYNNFFYDMKQAGIECSDSASCYIESNVFNNEKPVSVNRFENGDELQDPATKGFVYMVDN